MGDQLKRFIGTVVPVFTLLCMSTMAVVFAGRSAVADAQVGVLTCASIPGTRFNLLIHSSVDVDCVFKTPDGPEYYSGEMGIGIGVDLNWNRNETIRFGVIAGGEDMRVGTHMLSGKYMGGKASVTVGMGAGAAALVGGGGGNYALQPLGLESSEGWGLSGGLGYLLLRPTDHAGAADAAPIQPQPPVRPQ